MAEAAEQARRRDEDLDPCLFCDMLTNGQTDRDNFILWRGEHTFAVLNAYPYTGGHFMVVPYRHVSHPQEMSPEEARELWSGSMDGVSALGSVYDPEGFNMGANLGRAAGAGVVGHFHFHVLGRWTGDANFLTTVAEARVLPEALPETWARLSQAWPK